MKSEVLPIEGIDYVEMYVGNAKQASYFYQNGFGFTPVAFAGPETGVKDKTSYLLQQGDIRLLLTTGLNPDHPISRFVLTHGDGVADIALRVKDTEWTYNEAIKRGAKGIRAPTSLKDDHGVLKGSAISAYGDTVHTFIERDGYKGVFAPGFVPIKGTAEPVGLQRVDHVVANVEEGKMDYWVEFYGKVFGFSQLISFDDKDISTEYSALRSKVMRNPSGTVKYPINEPAPGKAYALLRTDTEERKRVVWKRQFQSSLRVHRTRTGKAGQSLRSHEAGHLRRAQNPAEDPASTTLGRMDSRHPRPNTTVYSSRHSHPTHNTDAVQKRVFNSRRTCEGSESP